MKLILKHIGPVSSFDLSFMTDDPAIEYIESLNNTVKAPKISASNDLEKLKYQMLQFNPYFRCSAAEVIKHKNFDKIRLYSKEKSATEKIFLEIDSDKAYDYETGHSNIYKFKDYRKIVEAEAKAVH